VLLLKHAGTVLHRPLLHVTAPCFGWTLHLPPTFPPASGDPPCLVDQYAMTGSYTSLLLLDLNASHCLTLAPPGRPPPSSHSRMVMLAAGGVGGWVPQVRGRPPPPDGPGCVQHNESAVEDKGRMACSRTPVARSMLCRQVCRSY
jgi:hypothetical protein